MSPGTTFISATDVLASETRITGTVLFEWPPSVESWDVVVEVEDGTEARLAEAFVITSAWAARALIGSTRFVERVREERRDVIRHSPERLIPGRTATGAVDRSRALAIIALSRIWTCRFR